MMFLRSCITLLLVTCFSSSSFAYAHKEDFYKRKGAAAALPWPADDPSSRPPPAGASSDTNPGGGARLLPSPPPTNSLQPSLFSSSPFSRFSDASSQISYFSLPRNEIAQGFSNVKLPEQLTVINNSLQFYSSPHFVPSSNSSVASISSQKNRLPSSSSFVATTRSLSSQSKPKISTLSNSPLSSPVPEINFMTSLPNTTLSRSSHNSSTSTQSSASLAPSSFSPSLLDKDSLLSSTNSTSSLSSHSPQLSPSGSPLSSSRRPSPHEEFKEHSIFTPVVVHGRTKRHIPDSTWHAESREHHHDITLGLAIEDENVLVDLQLNRELLPHGYFEKRLLRNGSRVIRRPTGQDAGLCHYQGSIRDKPGSWAALSTCHGLSGMVYDGNETHYVERLPESEPSLSSPHFLFSHKHLVPRNLSCGYKGHNHPSLDLFKDENFARMLRYKRSTSNSLDDDRQNGGGSGGRIRGPYNSNSLSRYVELVLVADHLEFQNQGEDVNKIHKRFKDIANIANALYQPLNIFIALVGVEVWEEEDQVVISQDGDLTLTNFLNYRKVRLIPEHPNDNAQLLTGQVFDSGVVGKALKGPICTYQYSGGVNMDHSSSVGLVATTVAHEMGHNFGMEHDTEEDCQCPDSRCIMAPSSGSRSPSHWSSCSHEYLALSFERSMDYCLRNKPRTLFDSPVCGNSFVEPGEQCDCGLSQHCTNPCCDPETCLLYANATCATGQCCDLMTCRPKEAGTECRSAHRECDLPEYCRGDSEYCPDDVFQEDGHECHAGKAFCHSGMCRSHEQQCQLLWGPTGQNSHDDCYSLNTQGNNNGNCGYNWANDTYSKCSTVNRKCGMMHCKHFNERLEFGMESVSKVSHRFIQGNEREIIPCRVAQVDLGLDMVDPGLAPDGAKCGYQKMCVNQVCMPVASLRKEGCNCHGNGACNNLGHCHCALGFAPPDCLEPGYGGSIDSGPASNPHATNKFVVGLFVFFFAIIPLVVASLCLVYYVRGNLGLIGLWLTKKGLPGSTRLPSCDPEAGRRGAVGLQRGISTASTGGVPSSPVSSCESKSNSPLLNGSATIVPPSVPVTGAKGDSTNEFFGKHPGFTLAPVDNSNLSNGVGSPVHSVNGVANGITKASSVPPQPVRQAPTAPAKVSISRPSLKASTNRAVQPVSQAPSVPKTLPPPPPPSSIPPVAVVNPQRRPHSAAPRPLSVPDHNSVIISRPSTAMPVPSASPANSSKSSGSTVSRIASFLNKKDKSADEPSEQDEKDASRSSTLPRKASKINRESLMQLEISAPMQLQATKLPENLVPVRAAPEPPASSNSTQEGSKSTKVTWAPSVNVSEKRNAANSSDIQRIGSMREPSVTLRPPIPKFGSMRTPRPKSLPPARPSDPPPRPPLPTIPSPGSDDLYDDCAESYNSPAPMASLEEDTSSPTESIYATIEEGTSPENASSVESKILDSDAAEQEPFYANSSAITSPEISTPKKSMFSFLYGKAKRKKKDSVEEPLYSNIGGNDTTESKKGAPSPPSRSSSLTPPDRTSCGSSEDGGLLSEIVSELVTREPDFRDALVHKKKVKSSEEKRGAFSIGKNNVSLASNRLDSLDDSSPLPKVDSTSSSQVSRSISYPWKSQAASKISSLSSSHSAGSDNQKPLSKPGSVLSYLKRSLPDDQEKTIVEDTGQKSETASPDLKCPITAMSNTTITTQIMSDATPGTRTQTTSANNRLESSLEAVRVASKQLKSNDHLKAEDASANSTTPLYSNVPSKNASSTAATAKPSPASTNVATIAVKPSPVKQVPDNVALSVAGKVQAKLAAGKPIVSSAGKPFASQVSISSGNSVDKSSSSMNSAPTASISSASSKSGPSKSSRPAFPPDKVIFPPDKPVVSTKASKTEGATTTSSVGASRANARTSSAGKGKTSISKSKTTGNNASSSGKSNESVSKPARVLSPTRPSTVKGPQTADKGNTVTQSKSSIARTKSPGVGSEPSDSKEPKKSTLSSSSTSAARSSGRRPAVRSNTAFGGKSVGSSNVASLQQKFEKEATGSFSAENTKAAVPVKTSSARKTSDSKPSVTPKPRT